jgi:D-alanine transaminase
MTMQTVYLNGEYIPLAEAKVSVLDRGFIFGDGVYEVIPIYNRKPFRLEQHLQRLQSNLDAIRITNPFDKQQWSEIFDQVINANEPAHQSLYMQITRGVAKRDHAFPEKVTPTIFVMVNPLQETDDSAFNKGISAITLDDIRWQYCNIKAIALLPNVLLKQTAIDDGAQEAILLRNGEVTEGSASNIFIVSQGVIKTPPKTSFLLPGITRDLVVELAKNNGLAIKETGFSGTELQSADEIWITSSTKEVMPVLRLDDKLVGNGQPGPVTCKMFDIFQAYKNELKQA